MIPRFKPHFDSQELKALLANRNDGVLEFEEAFAHTFGATEAVAFPYGRSALWAFLKAMTIENAEIILPAYTCSVVAHAVVLSGNRPRFVDIDLHDFNMDLDLLSQAINQETRLVLATHLFGYPLNFKILHNIIKSAEDRFGHKIWVIQDCAHSFGAEWQGENVCVQGDAALFGLNISKTMSSIFGGMLTFQNSDLAVKVRHWRDENFNVPGFAKALRRLMYLSAVYPAFNDTAYGFVNWLQNETPVLNYLTEAYHLDEIIHFPPDYQDHMLGVEARVGLAQLEKYESIIQRRRENARFYDQHLPNVEEFVLPPVVDGATYSHYVVRVPDRDEKIVSARKKGIELGDLIDYSMPHMKAYQEFSAAEEFPNSLLCSQQTINLPIHNRITDTQLERIVSWAHSL